MVRQIPVTGDPGEPLFLTPLIEAGNINEAKKASRVGVLEGAERIESYSGYITVNKSFLSTRTYFSGSSQQKHYSTQVSLMARLQPNASACRTRNDVILSVYSSPMASLVLLVNSKLTADGL
uniref:(California timema) hypothetical protein n=1 Tax=Timema californicum TaxID=61474 RepID=A0A7R9J9Z5_TIMCA|nr:unnamed protein product [Timema californicum]